jgi:hypothetical protein
MYMDVVEESTNSAKSFVTYLTRFDNETKNELLNVGQYAMMSILPIALLNKGSQKLFPEVDEEKATFEIALEAIGQIVYLFVGIYFVHRLITFVQPYSGEKYQEFNLISMVIPFLVIVLSLQSKLGEKINILVERGLEMVDEYTGMELSGAAEKEAEAKKEAAAEKKEAVAVREPMQPGAYGQQHQQMIGGPSLPNPQTTQAANEQFMQQHPQAPVQQMAPPSPPVQEPMQHMNQQPQTLMESAGSGMLGGESGSLAFAAF